MILSERLRALHTALVRADLPHAFGGAFALAYAVEHPRATADIDINIFVSTDATEAVIAALPRGVAVTGADRRRLAGDGQARLYWDATPVDVFLSTHEFHQRVSRRTVEHSFAGSTLPFLHPTDLVVFKAMFDRPKDRVDIAAIAESGTADLGEAQAWIDALVGADSLNAVHLREAAEQGRDQRGGPLDRPARPPGAAQAGDTSARRLGAPLVTRRRPRQTGVG